MGQFATLIPGQEEETVRELVHGQALMLPITTPAVPGDELKIEHNLGRIPNGYTLMTRPFQTFQHGHDSSDTDWDAQFMYLRFSIVDTDLTIAVF